jgi:HD superfamily phosphohydrolase
VVSSQFDADRLDYVQRDRLMTGSQHGAIDFEWLLSNIEVGSVAQGVDEKAAGNIETFVLGRKALFAAEAYVLGLFQLYPTIYFHKTTRSAEKIFVELLSRVISLVREGSWTMTGLTEKSPIAQFAMDPDNVERVLPLDDTVVWGALSLMADASDPVVSEFALRLRDRKLFKCIDVREKLIHSVGARKDDPLKVDKACAAITEKVRDWISEQVDHRPRILIDEAEREPYKMLQDSKGPLNQIRIRTATGELTDLGERSPVVKAIETFRVFRCYVDREDQEAQDFIEKSINDGVRNARGR